MSDTVDMEARRKGADLAIKAAGTLAGLAGSLGLTKGAIWQWRTNGIPAERVRKVSAVTGLAPHELRPDVFPAPALAPVAVAG